MPASVVRTETCPARGAGGPGGRVMDAEVSARTGAGYRERSRSVSQRVQVQAVGVFGPVPEGGELLPELIVIQQAYSTRRVDDRWDARASPRARSHASAQSLTRWSLGRPWTEVPTGTYGCDALTQKVRESGRIVNVSMVVVTVCQRRGQARDRRHGRGDQRGRCLLAGDSARWPTEVGAGVELVISDAHRSLRDAIASVLASWQRCRTHFMTNLLTRVPRRAQPAVATMVRTVYQQPSADEVHAHS